jgi:hypothetical protein
MDDDRLKAQEFPKPVAKTIGAGIAGKILAFVDRSRKL